MIDPKVDPNIPTTHRGAASQAPIAPNQIIVNEKASNRESRVNATPTLQFLESLCSIVNMRLERKGEELVLGQEHIPAALHPVIIAHTCLNPIALREIRLLPIMDTMLIQDHMWNNPIFLVPPKVEFINQSLGKVSVISTLLMIEQGMGDLKKLVMRETKTIPRNADAMVMVQYHHMGHNPIVLAPHMIPFIKQC